MSVTPARPGPRFRRDALNARARWRLLGGLALLVLSLAYAAWGVRRLGTAGGEVRVVDAPVVRLATKMTAPLRRFLPEGEPRTQDEQLLQAIVRDQQDVVFGLTVLLLRLLLASTIGGLGLVLLTAGSTEWELRSESVRRSGASRPDAPDPSAAQPKAVQPGAAQPGAVQL